MSRRSRLAAASILVSFALIGAACGDDDGGGDTADETTGGGSDGGEASGGEIIDLGTFPSGPPTSIDPALNQTIDAYQVINALYDGLTEVDTVTDPENPEVKPLVAESWETNDDATVWTFTIKEDAQFSNGEPVLPSSFVRAWERASDPDFAGPYSYLFGFIEGAQEKLDGEADTISGLEADDAARTLTVTLAEPYSNFPSVAGFQLFMPMPEAVDELADQAEWEQGIMIGNGPYKMESPKTDTEMVLIRNENWGGDIFGNTTAQLDKITFGISADVDSAYNSFEAGESQTARIPPGRAKEADENYGTTLDVTTLSVTWFEIGWEDPQVGGPENVELRRAISRAIDREAINDAVYDGTRTVPSGVTPAGIPGYEAGLCEYCTYDPDAAQEHFDTWKEAGHSLDGPVQIQLNAGAGWEDMVQIMIDNMGAIGIDAEAEPFPTETYFPELETGACVLCRSGWTADYPTYDNFLYDLFHTDAIGGNNHGRYSNPEFDQLVDDAKATVDAGEQADLFRQAERILLNDDTGVVPILQRRGGFVYNDEELDNFIQTNLELVLWEQITLK